MIKYLIFFTLLCVKFLHAKECNDCIAYTSCPNAVEHANRQKNPSMFRNAFCGYDTSQPKRPAPKVCCSDFPDVRTNKPFGSTEKTTTAKAVCDDCVVYTSCPKALESFQNRKNQNKFKSFFCGYDTSQSRAVSKVCCSAFDEVPIESHPNARLLPTTGCGDINGRRIVGGTIAGLYEFPWMALIAHSTVIGVEFKCGGSIINSRYILTAAHCVRDKIVAGVRVGEHDVRKVTDCQGSGGDYICESHIQDLPVEQSIVHESFSTFPNIVHDIALLRLKDTIDFSYQNVAPVCLPATDKMRNIYLDSRIATVAGWGLTERFKDSCFLRKVDIPIIGRNVCLIKYNERASVTGIRKNIDINQICAGQRYKDSCNGDSGGPLMLENEYQGAYRIVQYGIVSHGPKECGSDIPGVYTDVSKYMDWILDNMRE